MSSDAVYNAPNVNKLKPIKKMLVRVNFKPDMVFHTLEVASLCFQTTRQSVFEKDQVHAILNAIFPIDESQYKEHLFEPVHCIAILLDRNMHEEVFMILESGVSDHPIYSKRRSKESFSKRIKILKYWKYEKVRDHEGCLSWQSSLLVNSR